MSCHKIKNAPKWSTFYCGENKHYFFSGAFFEDAFAVDVLVAVPPVADFAIDCFFTGAAASFFGASFLAGA